MPVFAQFAMFTMFIDDKLPFINTQCVHTTISRLTILNTEDKLLSSVGMAYLKRSFR